MARFDLEPRSDLDPQIALLVAAWADGTREWLGEIGEVPDDAVVRRHGKHGVSIGALMMHMIDCDEGWIGEMVLKRPSEPRTVAGEFCKALSVDKREFPEPPAWPFSQYVDMMRETRSELIDHLVGRTPDQEFESSSGNSFTLRWILAHLVQHDSYHGGQIVLLLEDFS
ncbi:MAG: DUF664 domain-containing protein [Fimbriimonadaceae bacterium]|nr:DUF664 domain-containing protein [Fimbriimonadaceae bacterium]QYK58712.1 MAG: DUF664 domain-containing protein [Fimbriimonadaceae bacterium]